MSIQNRTAHTQPAGEVPPTAVIVVDLTFGDAGKGTMVDFLVRRHGARTVVRYNGGAQAGHNVVLPDGRHHTFSQFGSGTFVTDVRTHLSRFMLVHPLTMISEEKHLHEIGIDDAFDRLTVDEDAIIITPFHQAANRLKEMNRGDGRHGSCGLGIAETASHAIDFPDDAVHARDLTDRDVLVRKLEAIRLAKTREIRAIVDRLADDENARAEIDVLLSPETVDRVADQFVAFAQTVAIVPATYLRDVLREENHVVFEGAQGILIDEWHGFHPFTTWSTITTEYAETLLREAGFNGRVEKIGVVRSYATRHGPGPFVTESAALTESLPDPHNGTNAWQRNFRVGTFDLVATRYAIEATGGVDVLAVTHLDRHTSKTMCVAYALADGSTIDRIPVSFDHDLDRQEKMTNALLTATPIESPCPDFLAELESATGTPVRYVSHGPTHLHKRVR